MSKSRKKNFSKIKLPKQNTDASVAKKFISSADIISQNTIETKEIDKSLLVPYVNPYGNPQPFKLFSEVNHLSLVDSIQRLGLLHPIVVRKINDKYQILAGHNRVRACVDLDFIKSTIVSVDDDTAHLIVLETNLEQREQILPSEKAIAIAEKMEILNRQGKKSSEKIDSAKEIAEQIGESRANVYKYKKISKLNKELLNYLDNDKITLKAAYILSDMSPERQDELVTVLNTSPKKVNEKIAVEMVLLKNYPVLDALNNKIYSKPYSTIKIEIPLIYSHHLNNKAVIKNINALVNSYLRDLT